MHSWSTQRVTLGFSCQSTSTSEMISANTARSPFDYNVTTKDFILKSLRSSSNPFDRNLIDLRVYKQPVSGIEGVHTDGMFFWHDFERNGDVLADNWSDGVEDFLERYERRWRRFVHSCRRSDIKKQFVLTNTQSNLGEFCDRDFKKLFGIDGKFLSDLIIHLDHFGALNYCIDITVRDIDEYLTLMPIINMNKGICRARFCGAMHLPPHSLIVHETGLDLQNTEENQSDISEVCGLYDCGLRIVKFTSRSAIIFSPEKAEGEIRVFPGGYVLALSGGFDYFLRATFGDDRLNLSNKHVWTKLS